MEEESNASSAETAEGGEVAAAPVETAATGADAEADGSSTKSDGSKADEPGVAVKEEGEKEEEEEEEEKEEGEKEEEEEAAEADAAAGEEEAAEADAAAGEDDAADAAATTSPANGDDDPMSAIPEEKDEAQSAASSASASASASASGSGKKEPASVKKEATEEAVTEAVKGYLEGKDLSTVKLKHVKAAVNEEFGFQVDKDFVKAILLDVLDAGKEEEDEEDESAEESEDEDAPKRKRKAPAMKKKKAAGKRKTGLSGALLQPSPIMQAVIGAEQRTRPQVVKALWAYYREHGCQNPKKKSEINCDDKLEALFRRPKVTMFSMNKFIGTHLKKPDDDSPWDYSFLDTKDEDLPKSVPRKRKAAATNADGTPKKRAKGGFKEQRMSTALAEFMGVEKAARTAVVKRINEYIKEKELQNPKDGREIILDEALTKVFKRKKFTYFTLQKFLTPHMLRDE